MTYATTFSRVLSSQAAVCLIGGQYATAPETQALLSEVDCWDSSTHKWALQPSLTLSSPLTAMTAVDQPDHHCVIGGINQSSLISTVQCWKSSNWCVVGHLSQPRAFATAFLLHENKIGVVGGLGQSSWEIFNSSISAWVIQPGSLNISRASPALVYNTDGGPCVAGGSDAGLPSRSVECLLGEMEEPRAGNTRWVPGPPLTTPRADATAILIDGLWCLVGGRTSGRPDGVNSTNLDSVECMTADSRYNNGSDVPTDSIINSTDTSEPSSISANDTGWDNISQAAKSTQEPPDSLQSQENESSYHWTWVVRRDLQFPVPIAMATYVNLDGQQCVAGGVVASEVVDTVYCLDSSGSRVRWIPSRSLTLARFHAVVLNVSVYLTNIDSNSSSIFNSTNNNSNRSTKVGDSTEFINDSTTLTNNGVSNNQTSSSTNDSVISNNQTDSSTNHTNHLKKFANNSDHVTHSTDQEGSNPDTITNSTESSTGSNVDVANVSNTLAPTPFWEIGWGGSGGIITPSPTASPAGLENGLENWKGKQQRSQELLALAVAVPLGVILFVVLCLVTCRHCHFFGRKEQDDLEEIEAVTLGRAGRSDRARYADGQREHSDHRRHRPRTPHRIQTTSDIIRYSHGAQDPEEPEKERRRQEVDIEIREGYTRSRDGSRNRSRSGHASRDRSREGSKQDSRERSVSDDATKVPLTIKTQEEDEPDEEPLRSKSSPRTKAIEDKMPLPSDQDIPTTVRIRTRDGSTVFPGTEERDSDIVGELKESTRASTSPVPTTATNSTRSSLSPRGRTSTSPFGKSSLSPRASILAGRASSSSTGSLAGASSSSSGSLAGRMSSNSTGSPGSIIRPSLTQASSLSPRRGSNIPTKPNLTLTSSLSPRKTGIPSLTPGGTPGGSISPRKSASIGDSNKPSMSPAGSLSPGKSSSIEDSSKPIMSPAGSLSPRSSARLNLSPAPLRPSLAFKFNAPGGKPTKVFSQDNQSK